MLKFKLFSFNI